MRLRYSEEANTPFVDFMDQWLDQMKTQVRENTMDGYRYAFEKHIRPFFTARGTTLATARPIDFQDFCQFEILTGPFPDIDRQISFDHAQMFEICGRPADYSAQSFG